MTAPAREQSQSLLLGVGEVTVEPAEVPEPGPHQVLVEVAAVGVCGSDVHYFDHGRIADFVVREPLVLGHEASGVIRAVGSEVRDRTPGQRVALEPLRAHPVPDSLSDEAAALIEPLSVGVWAARKADIAPGDRVLVTGAGPVGLLCADVARARGAA